MEPPLTVDIGEPALARRPSAGRGGLHELEFGVVTEDEPETIDTTPRKLVEVRPRGCVLTLNNPQRGASNVLVLDLCRSIIRSRGQAT